MAGGALINIVLAGPLQQILGVIKSTQILLHLLLIDVATPASASIFFSKLMDLITLQFLDMDTFYDEHFALDDEAEPLTQQFETLGYESLYVLKNLGTVCPGMLIPVILWLVVYAIIQWIFPKYKPF